MSKPTTKPNYTTVVKNRLHKLTVDWAIYQANKIKAEKQKYPLYKEIGFLVNKYGVIQTDVARAIGLHRQQVNTILKMQKGGDTT